MSPAPSSFRPQAPSPTSPPFGWNACHRRHPPQFRSKHLRRSNSFSFELQSELGASSRVPEDSPPSPSYLSRFIAVEPCHRWPFFSAAGVPPRPSLYLPDPRHHLPVPPTTSCLRHLRRHTAGALLPVCLPICWHHHWPPSSSPPPPLPSSGSGRPTLKGYG